MAYAILAIVLFVAATLLLPRLAAVSPSVAAMGIRRALGGGIMATAAFTALRGLLPVAISLFLLGLAIYGARGVFRKANKDSGQTSSVKTSVLEMTLDHDTGEMHGEVIKGEFAGRMLHDLDLSQLIRLLGECQAAGDRSDALLAAFLDREHPDWRASAPGGAPGQGPMTREEAFEVLGLAEGANREDIMRAYRDLMKQHHPDQGGAAWIAARINEAKSVLLDE